MSTIAMSLPPASISDTGASNPGNSCRDGVVEINLLLPAQWADELLTLSRDRRQSIGAILRSMIGQALNGDDVQS